MTTTGWIAVTGFMRRVLEQEKENEFCVGNNF
jgi:hypothetical protein